MSERYVMIVDSSLVGLSEHPIISVGNTLGELAAGFEEKSEFFFLVNHIDGEMYCPIDIAVVFDMVEEGLPLKIDRVMQLRNI
jgi:hypothetical protein